MKLHSSHHHKQDWKESISASHLNMYIWLNPTTKKKKEKLQKPIRQKGGKTEEEEEEESRYKEDEITVSNMII